MNSELEEMAMEYERTHAAACITEKRGKNFDKVVGEWKAKADDLMAELDASHSEARNYSNERFRLKSALDESNEQLDIVRRENKNLADEIKDLLNQLGDGGRSIHELDKQRRRLESEKEEAALKTQHVPWLVRKMISRITPERRRAPIRSSKQPSRISSAIFTSRVIACYAASRSTKRATW